MYVSSVPISWILTGPGRPWSGTARTSDGGAAGGCDLGGRLRSRCAARVKAPAVAPMATAASETTTGFGTYFEVRTASPVGSADASLEAALSLPLASTAITTK